MIKVNLSMESGTQTNSRFYLEFKKNTGTKKKKTHPTYPSKVWTHLANKDLCLSMMYSTVFMRTCVLVCTIQQHLRGLFSQYVVLNSIYGDLCQVLSSIYGDLCVSMQYSTVFIRTCVLVCSTQQHLIRLVSQYVVLRSIYKGQSSKRNVLLH